MKLFRTKTRQCGAPRYGNNSDLKSCWSLPEPGRWKEQGAICHVGAFLCYSICFGTTWEARRGFSAVAAASSAGDVQPHVFLHQILYGSGCLLSPDWTAAGLVGHQGGADVHLDGDPVGEELLTRGDWPRAQMLIQDLFSWCCSCNCLSEDNIDWEETPPSSSPGISLPSCLEDFLILRPPSQRV